MKNLDIFDLKFFFFIENLLKKGKKSICSLIIFVLLVINLKVILKEFLSLTNLSKAQAFYIHKPIKIIIID